MIIKGYHEKNTIFYSFLLAMTLHDYFLSS
jgi:hypothetical protein